MELETILVTGGTGLVGAPLVRQLRSSGRQVRVLARGVAGREAVAADVADADAVLRAADGCSLIFHLAGNLDEADDDEATGLAVLAGMTAVIEAARAAGVGRIVYLSCLGARADAPSRCLEAMWRAESRLRDSGIECVILRSSLVFGSGDSFTRALADLVRRSPVLPLPPHAEQRVQPLWVEDLVRMLVIAGDRADLAGQTLSVGGPSYLTVGQMADLIAARLGKRPPRKIVLPESWLLRLGGRLQDLGTGWPYSPTRLIQIQDGAIASQGTVPATFGFTPAPFADHLDYLAR